MASFEDIGLGIPQIPLTEKSTKKTIKTETEAGYLRTRARSVRSFKSFSLRYTNLNDTKLQSLLTFFDTNAGESFVWQHPVTTTTYNVVFENESLDYAYNEKHRVEVSISLREVW